VHLCAESQAKFSGLLKLSCGHETLPATTGSIAVESEPINYSNIRKKKNKDKLKT
jgi:hypothetical protein